MSEKKKYVYTYEKNCEICSKQFITKNYSAKICSKECVSVKLSKNQQKYTEEQIAKAIELKLTGLTYKEIEKITSIKKPSQEKIYRERNIRLTEEQKGVLLKNRWKDYDPIKDGQKQCSKCNLYKNIEEFHKHKSRKSGAISSCKECYMAYYKEEKELIKSRINKYRENNPEKIKESDSKYYENNKEAFKQKASLWAANNREKRKKIEKKYRKANQDQRNARTAEYRAKKSQAMPAWLTDDQINEIKQIYKNRPNNYHVDHIVPVNGEDVCGLHVPWNLQYLPEYQNESKGNKFFNETPSVAICHQYKRKLDTLQEDLENGMPLNPSLDNFILMNEEFSDEHKKFIQRYEWLGTVGYSPKWVFTARIDGKLGAVVIISEPNAYTKHTELEALISRGATASWTPKNLGSKMIMFSCNWMVKNTSKRVFFGYSDQSAGEVGIIYQACNFKYLGQHFGAKEQYTLLNGKTVVGRYFRKTSTYKRYASELDIVWQKEWEKENRYMDIKAIPKEVMDKLKQRGVEERLASKKEAIQPKGKYVLFLGSSRKEKNKVSDMYQTIFKTYLTYPKRNML